MQNKSLWTHFVETLTKNYANFNGRARRREYWGFALFYGIIAISLSMLATAVLPELMWVYYIFVAATLIPAIAVAIRRLHDTGKSGWFYLLAFIPIANFYILYLSVIDGDLGSNEYGPNPKNPDDEIASLGTE